MFGLFIFPARHLTMPQRCCNRLTSPCCNKNIIKLLSSLSILFMLSVFLFVSLLISGFIGGYIKTISSFYFKPSCSLLYLLTCGKIPLSDLALFIFVSRTVNLTKEGERAPLTFCWRSLLPPTPSSPPVLFEQSSAAPSPLDSSEHFFSSPPPFPPLSLLNDEALHVAPPLWLLSSSAAKAWLPWSTAVSSPRSLALSPPYVLPLCPCFYGRVRASWSSLPLHRMFRLLISFCVRLSSHPIHHLGI